MHWASHTRQMQRSEEPVNERQVNGEIVVHDLGALVPVGETEASRSDDSVGT
jgi:hypothetical protein